MTPDKNSIKIGCCGFRSSRDSYYSVLRTVEVQHTFYQPPQIPTLERWRAGASANFEFAIKAWQLITHQSSSPTYRRLKRQLTDREKETTGFFRPTAVVRDAWQTTRDCALALHATMVLFQCPASFHPTDTNIANMRKFFGKVKRNGLNFCWEPRGDWSKELVRDLCAELDLWHVVDPFSDRTTTPQRCYFRLHGRKGWRYTYEDAELEELYSMLPQDDTAAYVFFNNINMHEDALRFQAIVNAAG